MNRKIDAMHERFGRHEGKCRDCGNLKCYIYNNKRYYKCAAYGVTSSTATDWRLSWDACGIYNTLLMSRPIFELIRHESKREPILPLDGQTTIFESLGGIVSDELKPCALSGSVEYNKICRVEVDQITDEKRGAEECMNAFTVAQER